MMAIQLPNWEKTSDMLKHLEELFKTNDMVALLVGNKVVGYVVPPSSDMPNRLRKALK